ncbi:RidA family protein [Hydrogenophaga sp. OTU3427]|uniref:RidA family protein n=1 Tax=Hydrogenophaga sp. OTU3427 TaxID=3043856 RepID=UPI00313F0539
MPSDIDRRLRTLGIELPDRVAPAANYVPGVRRGDLLFISGQTPRVGSAIAVTGKVGETVSLEDARRAARICATRLIAVARDVLGSLDVVDGVVELTVYVHSTPQFDQPSQVADAASDLIAEVFGAAGRHARSAVCVAQLPGNAAVEIAGVFAVTS